MQKLYRQRLNPQQKLPLHRQVFQSIHQLHRQPTRTARPMVAGTSMFSVIVTVHFCKVKTASAISESHSLSNTDYSILGHSNMQNWYVLFITFRMLIFSCFHSSIAPKNRKPMKYKLLLKLPLSGATNNRFPPFCRKLMEAQVTKKWQNVSH